MTFYDALYEIVGEPRTMTGYIMMDLFVWLTFIMLILCLYLFLYFIAYRALDL